MFFLALSAAGQARRACVHYDLSMSGSRPSTVAVLGALNVAELAKNNEGLLFTLPSQVGDMENRMIICSELTCQNQV